MKIHGSSTAASGMKKDWPESRRVSGNKRHDAIAVSGQKNKNEADRANDLVPAYRLSLSEKGKELAALSKAAQQNDEGLTAKNPMAKQGVEQMALSDIEPWKPLRAEDLDWATQYERASLAETMTGIEGGISAVLRGAAQNPLAIGADIQMYLVRQLNAYGHHQKALGHTLVGDPYLSSVLDRLDALDPSGENPLVNEIRSLVGMTMHGKDIELFDKDGHGDLIRAYCAYLGIKPGGALNTKDKAGDYFNEKTAAYSFFQEMSRKAKQTERLLHDMLGESAEDEKRESPADLAHLVADRKDELADGMKAYKESLRTLHRLDDDAGEGADGKLSDKEKAEEKKHLLPSITAYDWQKISEKYLQENPELAAIFADNGMC